MAPNPAPNAETAQTETATETETQTAAETAAQTATETATQAASADDIDAGLPDNVKEILRKERQARRDAERRAKDAEGKVQSFEDRDKTELERASDRAGAAEKRATAAERRLIALEAKLPGDLAERLQGATEEELRADAERLAGLMKRSDDETPPPDFDGGARPPAKSLTREQIEAMSPEEAAARWDEVEKALPQLK